MAKFVELYCDETDGLWKITVWNISTKDFDPFQCDFHNLDYAEPHIHKATVMQRKVADGLRKLGFEVFVNTANPNSYFQIIPKWMVQMIVGKYAPGGGVSNDQSC